jgi:tetratricopeptide (TPR) repeat protein
MGKKPGARRQPVTSAQTERRPWPAWIVGIVLLGATLAVYSPAWRGGLLWDDDRHVTPVELRSIQGLSRIWFDLGATQQYYPIAHSAFWIEHRLFGDATLGYHLVNIGLHVLSATILLVILRRLAIPGAALAASLFALHPVQVESIAWISELKNALSGLFFLLALLSYLRFHDDGFDDDRDRRAYAASLILFALALLTKSVTATLPGVILVVSWWRRGTLEWRDVVPTLPFFAIGATAGLFTAWMERTYIGAAGSEFHFTPVERVLIAGHAVWFYLGKIVWPHPLVFEYPRWTIDPAVPWQYAFPVATLALVACCWLVRRQTRAPLAALLAFIGLLFPALGFVNVYPFRFSFVADHFQYLAVIPILVFLSAAAATFAGRRFPEGHWLPIAAAVCPVVALAAVTHAQTYNYADASTSYRAILERNPASWMAHTNLGALLRPTSPDEALIHLNEAVRLNPDSDLSHYNLANLLQQMGRFDEAVHEYRETIRLAPGMALAWYNLGNTLLQMQRFQDAESAYTHALRLAPDLAVAHGGLCRVLQATRRPENADRECRTAIGLQPDRTALHYDFAGVLQAQGRFDEAVAEYSAALALSPDSPEAHTDLGTLLGQLGRFDEARRQFAAAAALNPGDPDVHGGLCGALQMLERLDEASRECETAVRLQPDAAPAHYDLANLRQRQGRFEDAVREYREALRLQPGFAGARFNLATALQRLGRVDEARAEMTQAMRLAPDDTAAHLLRATALEGQGQLAAARGEYALALQANGQLAAARQGIVRIDAALPATHPPRRR